MAKVQKLIGTLIPLSALYSEKDLEKDRGTFSSGLIFLDWLKKTNQSAWQLLPLHETQLEINSTKKHVISPYKSYGIGLAPEYLPSAFAKLSPSEKEKRVFLSENEDWLPDYAFFCALRDEFGTDDWRIWEVSIQSREKLALVSWQKKLTKQIDAYLIRQWQLYQAYQAIHDRAKRLGILLIGDMSFYLSVQSPLVWAHQEVFQIEKDGSMAHVSGIPDVNKTHFGRQVWGHPLFAWGVKEKEKKIVSFWKIRLRYQKQLFDTIRIDHANAFFHYGSMSEKDEMDDRYKNGPGMKVFEELIDFARKMALQVFVEDSGEDLRQLRVSMKRKKIPGIKILRFALEEKKNRINKRYADVSNYAPNTVAYTTTHDTESLVGYMKFLTKTQKKRLTSMIHVLYTLDNKELAKRLRDAVIASPAETVIIPIQDWLLTTERINTPGTELPINDPNWHFRLKVPIEKLPTQ